MLNYKFYKFEHECHEIIDLFVADNCHKYNVCFLLEFVDRISCVAMEFISFLLINLKG